MNELFNDEKSKLNEKQRQIMWLLRDGKKPPIKNGKKVKPQPDNQGRIDFEGKSKQTNLFDK